MDENNNILNVETKDGYLCLPSIPDNLLPTVTIVTPTFNRKKTFALAIRNYISFQKNYPKDKLFWKILDDSYEDEALKQFLPNDSSIEYIYSSKKIKLGQKRNILANKCDTDIILHMDDDDYYYPDSVKIRVISMITHKRMVSGCMTYNCFNLIDDSQYQAKANEEDMDIGEGSLGYFRDFFIDNKFNNSDEITESKYFMKNKNNYFVNIPCEWILLALNHGKNTSGRKNNQLITNFSFLELLPAADYEFIKELKMSLLLQDNENKRALQIIKSRNFNVDKLSKKQRKNIMIREYLHSIPSRTTCTDSDYLVLCFPGEYLRQINFEEESELIKFIKENKDNYRFTVFTNCDTGYSYDGITLSPWWKWRSCNKYSKLLVWKDTSHLKRNINVMEKIVYNPLNFPEPEGISKF